MAAGSKRGPPSLSSDSPFPSLKYHPHAEIRSSRSYTVHPALKSSQSSHSKMLFNKNILTILAATAMAVSANPCSSDQTLVCCKKVGPNSKCQTCKTTVSATNVPTSNAH
ncbi:Uncharacterized protein HZ326_26725 [Fusarium oxysporum f. sp. albedinis]|nr:Uncharacterized protein HZ326_26725 [Fusarium oxysporum f. sp. albedinis]